MVTRHNAARQSLRRRGRPPALEIPAHGYTALQRSPRQRAHRFAPRQAAQSRSSQNSKSKFQFELGFAARHAHPATAMSWGSAAAEPTLGAPAARSAASTAAAPRRHARGAPTHARVSSDTDQRAAPGATACVEVRYIARLASE